MSSTGRVTQFLQGWAEGQGATHIAHGWGQDDCTRCIADAFDPWAAFVHAATIAGWRAPSDTEEAAANHSGILGRVMDTVQGVRNQFEPSFQLIEYTQALLAALADIRAGKPWPVPEVLHADGPDADCPHMEFEAGVTMQRILGDDLEVTGFWAEVTVACRYCDEIFRWTGVQPGWSPAGPRVSIDHRTLNVPFRPASRDVDFGMGLPGFDVNLIGPELGHERTAAAIRRRALEDAAELVRARIQPVMTVAARRELRHAESALRQLAVSTQ